jgi:hypothetical protein
LTPSAITPNLWAVIKISVDLEPLCSLYGEGQEGQRAIIRHSLALESAGADGVIVGTGQEFEAWRKKAITVLADSLSIGLIVRSSFDSRWFDVLHEVKPSMVFSRFDGADDENLKNVVTGFQVVNILVGLEVEPEIELVKAAGKMKCDFLILDCTKFIGAKTVNARIEEINRISRAAALGQRLSMGVVAAGALEREHLSGLADTKTIEEFFIGIPAYSSALVNGYKDSILSMRSAISL